MADQPTQWLPTEWPLYYKDESQFRLGTTPSGLAGAKANLAFTINNRPHHVYGIRFAISYELDTAFEAENYGFRQAMSEGGTDFGFDVTIDLSQTNVTNIELDARTLVGKSGVVWHPFPVPLRIRGGNNVKCNCVRKLSYPAVGDPAAVPVPTVQGVLVTGQMLSDAFPAGPPGSSGIPS